MARKKYDYIIIGGGICGLILTKALDQAGKSVALVEAQADLGGSLAHRSCPLGLLPSIQKDQSFSPDLKMNLQRFSSAFLSQDPAFEIREPRTRTYDSGKFKDFVGFGKRAPEFVDAINKYIQSPRVSFFEEESHWIESFQSELQSTDIYSLSTLIDVEINGDHISSITINDQKILEAESFIFTQALRDILNLKNQDILTKSNFQKAAKTNYWSSVLLEMVHDQEVCAEEDSYILMGGTDNSIPAFGFFREPGNFHGAQEKVSQISQWLSFIDGDLTADIETSGNLIREIKRQVKRAFGEKSQGVIFEKVSLFPYSHGSSDLRFEGFKQKSLNNLYLVPKECDQESGLIGRIDSAIRLLDCLDVALNSPDKENSEYIPELEA